MISVFLHHPCSVSSLTVWQQPLGNIWLFTCCEVFCVCALLCVCAWLPFLQLPVNYKDNKGPAHCHNANKVYHMLKLSGSSNEPQWTVWWLVWRASSVGCRGAWRFTWGQNLNVPNVRKQSCWGGAFCHEWLRLYNILYILPKIFTVPTFICTIWHRCNLTANLFLKILLLETSILAV